MSANLPYYPQVAYTTTTNQLGLDDISVPEIYETPLPGKTIIRVDLLRGVPGINVEDHNLRTTFYNLLTLDMNRDSKNIMFKKLYNNSPEFRRYVKEVDVYTEHTLPLEKRVCDDIKKRVSKVRETFLPDYKSTYKYLIETNGYVYYAAFSVTLALPELYGVKYIC